MFDQGDPQTTQPDNQIEFKTKAAGPVERQRPGCLTIYALLLFFNGLSTLLAAFAFGVIFSASSSELELPGMGTILGLGIGFMALFPIIMGLGIWLMTRWAWWVVIVGQSFALVNSVLLAVGSLFLGDKMIVASALISAMVSVVANGGFIYYFFINQELFNVGDPETGVSFETVLAVIAAMAIVMILIPAALAGFIMLLGYSVPDVLNDVVRNL
ncbi:MAG: hypothetical protein JXB38_20670 [Anaerolineales bacterium]|nr:hypothetical protein [Anaerolineales bacterium]